jgi:probable F420-dependent oxidoreductase
MVLPRIRSGGFIKDFAATVEAAGIESVWATEHVIMAADYEPLYSYSRSGRIPEGAEMSPMADPLEMLSFIAAASERLLLGTGVLVAPLHSPVVLAKRAATIDRLSGGRLLLGLGIGWQREEYEAVGASFRDRGRRLNEAIPVMRALWRDSPATFAGRSVAFERVYMLPQPERKNIPIIVAGNSNAAIERAGRLADGWYPHAIAPDEFAAGVSRLADAARAAGRRPEDITITVAPESADRTRKYDVDWIRRYGEAGATRLIVLPPIHKDDDLASLPAFVDRYQNEVLAKL